MLWQMPASTPVHVCHSLPFSFSIPIFSYQNFFPSSAAFSVPPRFPGAFSLQPFALPADYFFTIEWEIVVLPCKPLHLIFYFIPSFSHSISTKSSLFSHCNVAFVLTSFITAFIIHKILFFTIKIFAPFFVQNAILCFNV